MPLRKYHFTSNRTFQEFLPSRNCPGSFFLKPIKPNEIFKVVSELQANKSPGYDEIDSNVLKKYIHHLAKLCAIFLIFLLNKGFLQVQLSFQRSYPSTRKVINLFYLTIGLFPFYLYFPNYLKSLFINVLFLIYVTK